jgi:hypothetical protein
MDWRRTRVSADNTHHTQDGRPLYEARFVEVLKFHAPGLAPALADDGAMHIDLNGHPAYTERFARTFGFYGGFAAVDSGDGWFHIKPSGERAYEATWAWCGNHQGGLCAVRRADGRYLHIDPEGRPPYSATWRYVGDFRDGIGVVQADDGLHTHIDQQGELLHGRWLLDLDVFHKGFARARDEGGWTHVDMSGRPAYERRFAAVESFYNGQARVERLDGGLEVIEETGRTVVELRAALESDLAALSADLVGFWRTRTIATAVRTGVIEALPATAHQVAASCGLAPQGAERLLLALAELGLLCRTSNRWDLTSRGACLRSDHPWTLAAAALEYDGPMDELWRRLPEALRAGHVWAGPDIFGQVAADDARVASHHRMLRSYARHDYRDVPRALQLRGDEVVVDAGGGLGVLAGLLVDDHPGVHVVLLDRPEVLQQVCSDETGRLELRPADFFEPWDIEADAVVLARVLHDWDDDQALQILHHARRVLRPGGRVFVVEMVRSPDGVAGSLCDLHLLVATGGRERTEAEFSALLDGAGFELRGVQRMPSVVSVVEGVAR